MGRHSPYDCYSHEQLEPNRIMTPGRIGLIIMLIFAAALAVGAWNAPAEEDNQGGVLLSILTFVALLFVCIPALMRAIKEYVRKRCHR